jgi:hypothetical protein
MAKRRAKTGTRKPGRKTRLRAKGATARQSRKATRTRKTAKPTARKAASKSRKAAVKTRTPASSKRQGRGGRPKRQEREGGRPKPAALARPRRQLRDDDTIPGAPSSLNFAAKASAAESGHQMYHQRQKEHTEGGAALTGGDVDTDWNEAYSSGEETPGGDMSTPDQDVVEEIGRALGVEYEDAEELKGAEKIESRDRNRWEYDPASAEDYKDRNRREE